MADNNIIIRNVKVVTPTGDSARRGSSMSELSVTGDASIVISTESLRMWVRRMTYGL